MTSRRRDRIGLGRVNTDVVTTESGVISSDSLCTPPTIADPLADFFGGPVDCDPATNEHALIRARVQYTELGLQLPWGGAGVGSGRGTWWVNWPYSTNEPWADKAIYEMKIGNAREGVVLCMSATSTMWWQSMMLRPRRNPRVICTPRIAFYGPNGKPLESGARFDTALIYYGSRATRFDQHFRHVTRWSTWGR